MEDKKILVVDDEQDIRDILVQFLTSAHFSVSKASSGEEAIKVSREVKPDVVLLDICMPGMDGLETLKAIKKTEPDTEVIMVTAMDEMGMAISCMKEGAYGYLLKPINMDALGVDVKHAIQHRNLVLENKDYQANLEQKVEERTTEVQKLNDKLKQSFLDSVRILLNLLEVYEPFLGGHSKRVALLATGIGKKLGLKEQELFDLEIGALLHNIGILGVPDRLKTTPLNELSEKEQELIKQQPIFAQNILSSYEGFEKAGVLIRHHLERIDGSGYPDGLAGEDIPLGSRIIGTVNAYDEIKMRRQYSQEPVLSDKAKSEFAMQKVKKLANKNFENMIISTLEELLKDLGHRRKGDTHVNISELKPGMVLASDISITDGRLLLVKGIRFNPSQIAKIKSFYEAGIITNNIFIYKQANK